MLPLTSLLFWKYASPSYVFFPPRLEVCGMRLKDRFLTHGGLALWSRKHKWCGCLSVPLCCCPPPPPPPLHPLSLCFILPYAAHCALVTHSSLSLPLSHSQSGWSQRPQWRFPWVLTSATRHKQPTSSCGKTTWHPLLSSQAFFPPLRPSAVHLFPFLFCVSRCLILLCSFAFSLTFFLSHLFFGNSPFPTRSVPALPGETSATIDLGSLG